MRSFFLLLICWKSYFYCRYISEGKLRYLGFYITEEQLKNVLHQGKITSADVRNFNKENSNMVVAIAEKITEKSPLYFKMVRNIFVCECSGSHFDDYCRTIWIKSQNEKPFESYFIIEDSTALGERTLPQYSYLLTALTRHDSESIKFFLIVMILD